MNGPGWLIMLYFILGCIRIRKLAKKRKGLTFSRRLITAGEGITGGGVNLNIPVYIEFHWVLHVLFNFIIFPKVFLLKRQFPISPFWGHPGCEWS